jgi:hypothetical protein
MSMPAALDEIEAAAAEPGTYIHATALAIGEAGVLIRGRSGSGKSRLALELIAEAGRHGLFARLVGDDRVAVAPRGGRLVARPHPIIAGQIESRGEGILAIDCEAAIVVRLVVDLCEPPGLSPTRLPGAEATGTYLCEVELPRLCLDGSGPPRAGIVVDHLLRMRNG